AEASQMRAAEFYVEPRAAVGMRDDFLTVAAHELRTPLTTLRLQAQQLDRASHASAASRSLLRSVDRLCRLVDQLLDVITASASRPGSLAARVRRTRPACRARARRSWWSFRWSSRWCARKSRH